MKTYFAVSDIHSFYLPFKLALDAAGFNINNPDHILIVCGDIFDRGYDPLEVYNFIISIPKERRILIRGNHEDLFLELAHNTRPLYNYDVSNGTMGTFARLSGKDYSTILYDLSNGDKEWKSAQELVEKSEITAWLESDEWLNYYELGKYIFVHSFIPLKTTQRLGGKIYRYNKHWRTKATKEEWRQARWGCPWQLFDYGYFNEEAAAGKILVCGHWHSEDFHKHYNNIKNNFDIYFSEHLIAIDACTAASMKTNILVIKEEDL